MGVGGTPKSFIRAGTLGLPLVVAIIGGDAAHFVPLVKLYRDAGQKAGHPPERLSVAVHSIGFIADTDQRAADEYWPTYNTVFSKIGKERGWPPVTRAQFDISRSRRGALLKF